MKAYIEITSCDIETLWYCPHIGVSIEVTDRDDIYWQVYDPEPEKPWERKLIKKEHAKIIE